MKHIIDLSVSEAETLLQTSFQNIPNFEGSEVFVKIAVPPVAPCECDKYRAKIAVDIVNCHDYLRTEKIRAIRMLRVVTRYGLAEAKWVVENFSAFRGFVGVHNRIPQLEKGNDWNHFTMK